jgi:serine/threonine-protein kinase
VAIKVLLADVIQADCMARFRREAEIASRLGHPNIVEVHDFNQLEDGTPYLVLEYLEGETLADRLRRGPMSVDETFTVVRQGGAALAAAHAEGIVHRDLKPQNVFLVPSEHDGHTVIRAKVLDFGISKIRGSSTVQTQDSMVLGTPQYMSPEQAMGNNAAVDQRTDVFAMGTMVYEMLSGGPAFGGNSVPEVVFKAVYEEPAPLGDRVPGLGAPVIAAVNRAMAKLPEERFPSIGAFVEAFTGSPMPSGKRQKVVEPASFAPTAAPGSDIDVAPVPPPTGATKPQRLRRDRAAAAATAIAVGPATPGSRPARPRRAVIAAAAGLLAVAVGIVIAVRLRGAATTAAPATAAGEVAPPAPVDAAPVSDATVIAARDPDAGAPPSKPARPDRDRSVATPDRGPADASQPTRSNKALEAQLTEARAALEREPRKALEVAHKIWLTTPKNVDSLRIHVIAYCKLGDLEKARTWLNRLPKPPAARKSVLAQCARAGMKLD